MTIEARLMSKITPEPNSGCWIWLGADDGGDGYGRIVMGGKQRPAHRVSYEHFVGPIPDGLLLDHLCRVRCCINPAHLEPVTSGENTRRGFVGSAKHATCKRGHDLDQTATVRKDGSRCCRVCVNEARRLAYVPKGRPAAEKHPKARLTWADVAALREMWVRGATTGEIAKRFNITRSYAWNVANGLTWKHPDTVTEIRKAL